MERCGFFDAHFEDDEYDRVYLAQHFAAYFASFISNGVYAAHSNQLQVMSMATPQMKISVESGQAWINGYWYENTESLELSIDVADGVLNRIDSVVLRLGFVERDMWLAIKKGTPASEPIAPTITRDSDYYEIQLATINIPANSSYISQSQIVDTRMNQSACGWVTGLIQQIDTTTLFNQFQAYFEEFKLLKAGEFDTWFEEIKGQLSEDAAGNLQLQIDVMRREIDCINGAREKGAEINLNTLMGYVRAGQHNKYAIGDYFIDNNIIWVIVARNHYTDWQFGGELTPSGYVYTRPEHIVCMPLDILPTKYKFNNTNTASGGYGSSLMPANMETEFNKLGATLKGYCVETKVNGDVTNGNAALRKMRLPAIFEVSGNYGLADPNYIASTFQVSGQLPMCKNPIFKIRNNTDSYWCADATDTSSSVGMFSLVSSSHPIDESLASRLCGVRPLIVLA